MHLNGDDVRWNKSISARTISSDPVQTPSTSMAQNTFSLPTTAPVLPNTAEQWTRLNGGASSPFMPVFTRPAFTSPFTMLDRRESHGDRADDGVTGTQARLASNDISGLLDLPNRPKRGRTPDLERQRKRLRLNDHDLDSHRAVQVSRYPPERTLRVSGIRSNATKEELVFFFRGCPMYALMSPVYTRPKRKSMLIFTLEMRSNTILAKQKHQGTQWPSSAMLNQPRKPSRDSEDATSLI